MYAMNDCVLIVIYLSAGDIGHGKRSKIRGPMGLGCGRQEDWFVGPWESSRGSCFVGLCVFP